jgi:ATP synthase protein I
MVFNRLVKDRQTRDAILNASVLGLNLVSCTFVGLFLGWLLDRWLGTKPWLLLAFLILGIAAGFKNVFLEAKKINAADAAEKAESNSHEKDD